MSVSFWIDGHDNWETDPNFSNANAREVCDILGIFSDPNYPCGDIHPTDLDRVIRLATRAVNNENAHYGRQGFEEQLPGKCLVIECGTSDESVRYRLRAILDLCVKAKRLNLPVNFG